MLQVLTNSRESFVQMTKAQIKLLEKIYKDSIYNIMELSMYKTMLQSCLSLG